MELRKLRTAFIAAAALSLIAVPAAIGVGEGQPLDGGTRNPSPNQTAEYNQETEIIANNGSYGTRQSNKSSNGGGAIYGCRSAAGGSAQGNEPCIRANNLEAGFAFEFESNGVQAGSISVGSGGDGVRPFTTNATGVATGLNSDEVDGMSADEIISRAGGGGGGPVNSPLFAVIDGNGALTTIGANNGALDVERSDTGRYTVTFNRNVVNCAYQVTEREVSNPPEAGAAAPGSGNRDVDVRFPSNVDFSLTVQC